LATDLNSFNGISVLIDGQPKARSWSLALLT
jgi:hypothetical protein